MISSKENKDFHGFPARFSPENWRRLEWLKKKIDSTHDRETSINKIINDAVSIYMQDEIHYLREKRAMLKREIDALNAIECDLIDKKKKKEREIIDNALKAKAV